MAPLDFRKEFKKNIVPEINRRIQNFLLLGIAWGCSCFIVDRFSLPEWIVGLSFLIFMIPGLYNLWRFLYKIRCPDCNINIIKDCLFTPKTCSNCGAIFRDIK